LEGFDPPSDRADPHHHAERLAQEVPKLDAVINNAGMSAGGAEALSGHEDGAAMRLLALNMAAPARVVKACAMH
jgi:short-subunit dehydrogenase involved in D-alanine esterification of teichoic acids